MNLINRIVIILLILVAMILIPLGLIFPEQAEIALRFLADLISENLAWLDTLSASAQVGLRILLAVVGMIVFLIGLLFLALEVIRLRRRTVRLRDGSGELMMDGVAGHLSYHIDMLPDVARVRPQVTSRGGSVRTSIYVETAPDVNVPAKSTEIQEVARRVLEDQLGLQVNGEIRVLIKPAVYPRGYQGPAPAPSPGRQPAEPAPDLERPTEIGQEAPAAAFEEFAPPEDAPEPLRESGSMASVHALEEEAEDRDDLLEAKGPSA